MVLLTERQDDFARAIARGVTDYTYCLNVDILLGLWYNQVNI